MRRKLFSAFILVIAFTMMFAVVAFAESVHNENTVDYNATVTLDDGTVLPLYDENKEALIWYISGTDGGKNVYSSIRTDDHQVKWWTKSWGEVTSLSIVLDDGTSYSGNSFVVVNMMDDDVVSNTPEGNHTNLGKPITGFKWIFNGWKNLEYAYLRLDTTGIYATSFQNCTKLKYVNLKDLTRLTRIGDSNNFAGCTSLFAGQVLDLRNTSLTQIDWGGSFSKVPFVEIKLPSTISRFSGSFEGSGLVRMSFPLNMSTIEANMFKNCLSLESVCVNSKTTKINDNVFLGCTAFDTFCFVGTKAELEALITNTSATGNDPFFAVVGENNANLISYFDYIKLEDKSGKYAIYDYSYCEAYNDSIHNEVDDFNCATDNKCSVCLVSTTLAIQHVFDKEIVYRNGFASNGAVISDCTNEGCTACDSETPINPIFVAKGYSNSDNGIAGGYTVNITEYNEYVSATGKTITFGVLMLNPKYLDGKDNFFNGTNVNIDGTKGYVKVDMTNLSYKDFTYSITGFAADSKDVDLVVCAFAYVDGEDVEFIQDQTTKCASKRVTKNDATLYTVTFNTVEARPGNVIANLGEYKLPTKDEE